MTVIVVGHVTKDGQLAGPKLLEHMVDTVLHFEGDRHYDFRLLRTLKNRFGPTDEMGVFRMQDQGLLEISNPSELFLSNSNTMETGCSIFASLEGMRPILCEVQTLVTDTAFGIAKRTCVGFDMNRLSMILAILDSRLKMSLSQKDVYLNVAGGLKITEPSADLAVAASLISSYQKKPVPKGIFFGELSLSGHLRPVRRPHLRLQEAERLNLKQAFIPHQTDDKPLKNLKTIELISIQEYIQYVHRINATS
jgi:DNA repair protein RadA/Sms